MKKLFVSFYDSRNKERTEEIKKAIQFNIDSGWIDQVYILVDPGCKTEFKGVATLIPLQEKPTFEKFFSVANEYANNRDLVIISNSDMIFDESIDKAEKTIKENQCYALSRWEMNANMTGNPKQVQIYGDSQDVWIFRGKLNQINNANFPMGKMGCDNRIAHEIKQAGYDVLNPCKTIKTWHLHTVDFREYDNQIRNEQTVVQPPYLTIPLTEL